MQSPIYQDWVKEERAEAEAKGKIEGRIEGRIEGKIEGKIEAICKFMVRRFNADAGEIRAKVHQLATPEILDGIMEEVFAADTLEEAQSVITRAVGKSLQ